MSYLCPLTGLIPCACRLEGNGNFLPISDRGQTLFCGSEIKDTSDLIKKELKYVQEETQAKVKKLRLATDIHIGKRSDPTRTLT